VFPEETSSIRFPSPEESGCREPEQSGLLDRFSNGLERFLERFDAKGRYQEGKHSKGVEPEFEPTKA